VFRWAERERQVTLAGPVVLVDDAEADSYFASRPRANQIGAWASRQSQVVSSRSVIDEWVASATARFEGGDVPRPPFWGGYRIVPLTIEFWQGRPDRLHDRIRYRRSSPEEAWVVERLSP
jgi:pyridoxamine 5'-phosphate oxidase